MDSALPSTTDYAIEIKFQATDSVDGYNKLIDFQNLSSDLGFYLQSGTLRFYTASGNTGTVVLNTDTVVGLARAGGSLSIYQDGSQLTTVADGGSQAVPGSNILNFFEDDFGTSQAEAFTGSVDFIRIHDDATSFGEAPNITQTPVPGTLALFAGGIIAAVFRRWQR